MIFQMAGQEANMLSQMVSSSRDPDVGEKIAHDTRCSLALMLLTLVSLQV